MRAEQARRRRRRIRLASSAAAAAVIAVLAGITLAVTGGGSAATSLAPSGLNLAPLSTLGALQPAPAAGATGSEGVPVPAAAPLAGSGPADLYPRRILRRVGAEAGTDPGRPGHRTGGGPTRRQGLPEQPARHSPDRAAPIQLDVGTS
jgi:hypothetical protein